mgnify:FL=1
MQNISIRVFSYPDKFIEHGSVDELEKIYGLDEENIEKEIEKMLEAQD